MVYKCWCVCMCIYVSEIIIIDINMFQNQKLLHQDTKYSLIIEETKHNFYLSFFSGYQIDGSIEAERVKRDVANDGGKLSFSKYFCSFCKKPLLRKNILSKKTFHFLNSVRANFGKKLNNKL